MAPKSTTLGADGGQTTETSGIPPGTPGCHEMRLSAGTTSAWTTQPALQQSSQAAAKGLILINTIVVEFC
jgi:hypothetical protein